LFRVDYVEELEDPRDQADRVDALSNDIDGLSNFLKQVTWQYSEPDPGKVLAQ
jgi:hypothetical protein